MTDRTDLERLLPLPLGCTVAHYVGDMREVVQYDIRTDDYLIRHDWLHNGQKVAYLGEPITTLEAIKDLEDAVLARRQACLNNRGIA